MKATFANISTAPEITAHAHSGVLEGTIKIDAKIPIRHEAFMSNSHFQVAINYLFRARAQARIPAAARAPAPLAARFIEA